MSTALSLISPNTSSGSFSSASPSCTHHFMEDENHGKAASASVDPRWYFNFESWEPSEEEWQKCLSLIPAEERERIGRFKRPLKTGTLVGRHNSNAKSSMIGRLMLRKAAAENMGVLPSKQVWRRTTEGKPFILHSNDALDTFTSSSDGKCRAGYNLNVSHDGKLVAFVGGASWVLGVDVMCNTPSHPEPWSEFHPLFEENFTASEWKVIKSGTSDSQHFEKFMHHWTLKESYIKSIGYVINYALILHVVSLIFLASFCCWKALFEAKVFLLMHLLLFNNHHFLTFAFSSIGLGFELLRAEFSLDNNESPTSATVKIDGREVDWFFEVHTSILNHTISVSYGPIEDSIGSVQASLKYPGITKPSSPFPTPQRISFKELTIQELLISYE